MLAWLVQDVRNAGTAILLVFGVGLALAVPFVVVGLLLEPQSTLMQLVWGALITGSTGGGGLLVTHLWRARKARTNTEAENRLEESSGADEP